MSPGSIELAPDAAPLALPGRLGVRLTQFQLLNWGTFDGAVQRLVLDGGNGLLTGQVGTGKSTMVDGLTTLFSNRVTFNRAAGAEHSERSIASYVLGHYRNIYDESTGGTRPDALRTPKKAYSALLATFSGVSGTAAGTLSAGAVFWFGDGAAAPHRLYFLAPTGLDIAAHLTGHADAGEVRTALRAAGAELHPDNFRAYRKSLCRHLGISPAALDLLVQTISLKQVGNLTEFVRTHMLDAANTGERIAKILEHWADLNRAHELVVVAREQLDALLPVEDFAAAYDRADARITASEAATAAVAARVEARRVDLLDEAIATVQRQLPALEADVRRVQGQITAAEQRATALAVAVQAGGGAELLEAQHGVDAARDHLGDVQRARSAMADLARLAGLAAPEDSDDFARYLADLAALRTELTAETTRLRTDDFDANAALAEARRDLKSLEDELQAARSRDSNVPLEEAQLRSRIADELGLPPETLPFAAELLAVADDAQRWEPAAERLTRSFALALLVPDEHYVRVAAWVDANQLGRRLTYYRVPAATTNPAPARAGTMAAHLQVRSGTPVSAWLRSEVTRRYDHMCVETAAELAAHGRAVTAAGQVKDNARHDKDDRRRADDRRFYVLGWDTAARRAALTAALPAQRKAVDDCTRRADDVETARKRLSEREYAARALDERFTDQVEVDVGTAHDALRDAEELYNFFASSPDLQGLLADQQTTDAVLLGLREELAKLNKKVGAAEEQLSQHERARTTAHAALQAAGTVVELPPDSADALAEAVRAAAPEPTSPARCDEWGRRLTAQLHSRAESSRATRDRAGQRLVGAIKDFAAQWPEVVTDIPTNDPASRGEFRALRDRIATDDLPSYEQNFREQLQTNAIHELVAFSHSLDREASKITDRIETINTALADIDYQPGTYIRLEAERSHDPLVREFRGQLREITSNALLGDDDTYAELRFLKVKDLLDRFRGRDGTTSADKAWTERVTDVRNWFSFAASERTRAEDTAVEHYTDSGGKSGGQKEKLAYTVLAASLSYQYGLAGGSTSAFRFVMIDEAFGRGSDESTRFGLELFTRLGLQLLVVTPLQKIATIEPFVDAVGYVHTDDIRSRLITMTIADYRARRDAQQALTTTSATELAVRA